MPRLTLAGVSKSYSDGDTERRVLDGFSASVESGEIAVLWGPSGSGKSTLLGAVAGLLDVDSGSITLQTEDAVVDVVALDAAARAELRRARLGYIFQFFNLVPSLTVLENLQLPRQLAGLSTNAGPLLERLAALGLADRSSAFPAQLSGGEQQRVAVLRAMVHEPIVLLADEPTGNLDAANADRVVDLLLEESRQRQCAVLLATHSERIAERADTLITLSG